jgi:hypothetical protein
MMILGLIAGYAVSMVTPPCPEQTAGLQSPQGSTTDTVNFGETPRLYLAMTPFEFSHTM